jgi:acyl-coenzyme A thioesterase PaaI-like protein
VKIEQAGDGRAVLSMKNRRRVQNHIGGIHAAAMALLGESATGVAFGLSIPDSHLPLLKSMKIDYVRRAQGDLRAEASLTPEQQEALRTQPKGDANVAVKVTDSAGEEPIRCEFVWAWVPRKR